MEFGNGYYMDIAMSMSAPELPQGMELIVQAFYNDQSVCGSDKNTLKKYEYLIAYSLNDCIPLTATSSVYWATVDGKPVQNTYNSPDCTGSNTLVGFPTTCSNSINEGTYSVGSVTAWYPGWGDGTTYYARYNEYVYTALLSTTPQAPTMHTTQSPAAKENKDKGKKAKAEPKAKDEPKAKAAKGKGKKLATW